MNQAIQQPSAIFLITLLFSLGAAFYFVFSILMGRNLWLKGRVPRTMPFNNDNLFEVYVAFAVRMIKADRHNYSRKVEYLNSFFVRKFPEASDHLRVSLGMALKDEPIKIKSAARWLNMHQNQSQKVLLIYFLCDISFIDGKMNKRELEILEELCFHLKIEIKELNSIIAGLEEAYRRKNENRRKENSRVKAKPSISKRKRMAKILEVSENASFDEIKSAYRKLVKLHHPDRFQNDGVEQIELAKERFIEIQLAYEYFEDLNMS